LTCWKGRAGEAEEDNAHQKENRIKLEGRDRLKERKDAPSDFDTCDKLDFAIMYLKVSCYYCCWMWLWLWRLQHDWK
jgi:hypothetical protein